MEERSFPRVFQRGKKFIFIRCSLIEVFEKYVKEGSGNGQLTP